MNLPRLPWVSKLKVPQSLQKATRLSAKVILWIWQWAQFFHDSWDSNRKKWFPTCTWNRLLSLKNTPLASVTTFDPIWGWKHFTSETSLSNNFCLLLISFSNILKHNRTNLRMTSSTWPTLWNIPKLLQVGVLFWNRPWGRVVHQWPLAVRVNSFSLSCLLASLMAQDESCYFELYDKMFYPPLTFTE